MEFSNTNLEILPPNHWGVNWSFFCGKNWLVYNQSAKYYETIRNTVNLGLSKEKNIALFERGKKKKNHKKHMKWVSTLKEEFISELQDKFSLPFNTTPSWNGSLISARRGVSHAPAGWAMWKEQRFCPSPYIVLIGKLAYLRLICRSMMVRSSEGSVPKTVVFKELKSSHQ